MPQQQPAASTPELDAVIYAINVIHSARIRDTDHPAARAAYSVAIEKMFDVHSGLCSIRYRVEALTANGSTIGYRAVDTWTDEELSTHPARSLVAASLDIARGHADRTAKRWNDQTVTDRTQDLLTALRDTR